MKNRINNRKQFVSVLIAAAFGFSANGYTADNATWQSSDVEALSKGATFNGMAVIPNRVLVKWREEMSSEDADQALDVIGMWRTEDYQGMGISVLEAAPKRKSLQASAAQTAEQYLKSIIAELEASGMVLYAEPDYIQTVDFTSPPNDPRYGELWGLNNTGQRSGRFDADIDAPEAWDLNQGSADIVVGVIDTGVDYTHPDLRDNMWVNTAELDGRSDVDDDGNGYVDDIYGWDAANNDGDPMDDDDHGTHVSGTIGAVGNNGIGVVGVSPNVSIMALKFLGANGSGSTSDAIECLNYALEMKRDYGVNLKLTSNSWGGGGYSQALKDAIEATGAQGMLFIAAAGNDGTNNDESPHYPSNYNSDNIISVASTTRNDVKSSFSNYGLISVDLAAPGSSILSTVHGGGYASFSGTSMATPHVAGAAALVFADHPEFNHLQVKEDLMGTVDHLDDLTDRTVTGGRLNLQGALGCDESNPRLSTSLEDQFTVEQGREQVLSASLSACTRSRSATMTVSVGGGTPLTLLDDGAGVDATADDGVYSGAWTPTTLGAITLEFSATDAGTTYTSSVPGSVVPFVGYHDQEVTYDWVDISSSGTALNLRDDDHRNVPLPFTFEFYGTGRDSVSIGSNGQVYFLNNDFGENYKNESIPSSVTNHDFIALLWDDLNPASGGNVYYDVVGTAPNRRFVIQYQDVPHYVGGGDGGPGPYFLASGTGSFQAILEENGDILMQYQDVNFNNTDYDNGASATVGIQKDPSSGQQYSYNEAVLRDRLAIRWSQSETPPPAEPQLYFSLRKDGAVGGLTVANEDIIQYDGTNFSRHFVGSNVGLAGFRVNAFALASDTEILMSLHPAGSVPGVGPVSATDILKFTATSLGENTDGTFELYLSGNDYGLTQAEQQVDALEFIDGRLLISTAKSITAGGTVTSRDEDILELDTGGNWQVYFDGSDVSLDGQQQDLKAVAVAANGDISLSMRDAVTVPGVAPRNEDVFRFIPVSLGSSTSGNYDPILSFDGSVHNLVTNDISAMDAR